MHSTIVTYSVPKRGSEEWEWEDGAASAPGDPLAGTPTRFAVADGAAGGIGAARWAAQLVSGFIGASAGADLAPPRLNRAELIRWFEHEQVRWANDPHWARASGIALRKLREVGSLATVLGCELTGLGGPSPSWHAFAFGDTVLFLVRDGAVLQFPPIPADGFDSNPDGVPTLPHKLGRMLPGLLFSDDYVLDARLAVGDLLFVATDALAEWMIGRPDLWSYLAELEHPDEFRRFVAGGRGAGLRNDDVTLQRVRLTAAPPRRLVVCL